MITRRNFAFGAGIGLLYGVFDSAGVAKAAPAWPDELKREFGRIEKAAKGRLGVTLVDTAAGRRASHRGDEHFPMCSTFKLLACSALLARVDAGSEDLARRISFSVAELAPHSPVTKDRAGGAGMTLAELCAAAMTESDNTAANLILANISGPSGMTAFARAIGDDVTRLDRWEPDLNEARPGDPRDTTSPDAMAGNLLSLVVGERLSLQSRERLTAWLVANKTGGDRLRAGLPRGWRVGDKTGGGEFGTTNDIGVVWPPTGRPLILSVYLTDTSALVEERNAAIAAVGKAVGKALGSR